MATITLDSLGARVRNPWAGFVLRRTWRLLVSLAALVTAAFAMIHLIPGDPVRAALGTTADPALVAARRESLGLDQSLLKQYGDFAGDLLQGRLGSRSEPRCRCPRSSPAGSRPPCRSPSPRSY